MQLGLQVLLLLIGLGCLQVVADRTNRRFDLTPAGGLSLSPVTTKLLAEVKARLRITVFFQRGTRERYTELLERVRAVNRGIEFELLDLDRFPDRARSLGVTQYGRAAIEYEGRRVVVLAWPEEQLAGGILRALRGRARRLVFTTGHGERAPGGGPEGYGRLAGALEVENYAPEGGALLEGPVPPETDLLVVAGPKHDFLVPELEAMAAYLTGGGGVLMLLDPGPLPNLSGLLASMGVRWATTSSSTASGACSAPTGSPPSSSSSSATTRSPTLARTRSRAASCCRPRAPWTSWVRCPASRPRASRARRPPPGPWPIPTARAAARSRPRRSTTCRARPPSW
jgi:hypothetical protein